MAAFRGVNVPTPYPPIVPAVTFSESTLGTTRTFSLDSPATWPKWALALIVGIPVTATAAYLIYFRQKSPKTSRTDRKFDRWKGRTYPKSDGDVPSRNGLDEPLAPLSEPRTVAERISALKSQGNQLFKGKKYLDAKNRYSEAIDLAMQNNIKEDLAQSLQNRAACDEQLKLYHDVIKDCTKALELDNHYAKAYARRSRGHEQTGNLLQAVYDLVAASVLTNFENAEYRERSEKLLAKLSLKLAQAEMSKKASGEHKTRLSKTFVRQFSHGFSRDPVQIALKTLMFEYPSGPVKDALKAWSKGDYELVSPYCTEALTAASAENVNMARLLRGTVSFLLGNIADATTDLTYLVNVPDASLNEKSNARIKLACILLSAQDPTNHSEILSRLDDAVASDPTNPDIYFHRAQVHMIFNRFEECLNDFRKCQQLNSQDETSASAFHVAHIEYRLHVNQNPMDQHRALQLLEERLAQIKSPEGFLLLAQLLMEMQDFQKAEQYFRRALIKSPDPHNAIVYTQQALLEMLARENRDGCVVLLKKALDVDPDYSPALELMMDIELQAENLVEARCIYERCLGLAKNEMEMMSIIQAYQIGEAGQIVYRQLGIAERPLIPLGMPAH